MSGRKNVILPRTILDATMAADRVSEAVNVQYVDNIGLQISWSTTDGVGVITVEGSNDYTVNPAAGTWQSLTFSPALAQPNADTGAYLVDVQQFPFAWIRVAYDSTTAATGNSQIKCVLTAKEI